ncbi:MAG: transcriptional repressor NrdR [Clostridia bacterium]|nr:transcriptional repressor NrdR [Clostridia bacterium]
MKCIYCNSSDSRVVDSRSADDNTSIRRRRICNSCGKRFTTYERIEEIPVVVIKRDGSRQNFHGEKILTGIKKACEKRPIPIAEQNKLADDIIRELLNTVEEQEVATSVIGDLVMRRLKELDEVAYIRFACVHRQFKDIGTFMEELRTLMTDEH